MPTPSTIQDLFLHVCRLYPIDLRVMVQRRKSSPWVVTGKLAQVAGKGYIITNIARSKGTVILVETAIQRSAVNKVSRRAILAQIDKIALSGAEQLSSVYKKGYDKPGDQLVFCLLICLKPLFGFYFIGDDAENPSLRQRGQRVCDPSGNGFLSSQQK